MDIRRWIWCLQCERCFEVNLSREPEAPRLSDHLEAAGFASARSKRLTLIATYYAFFAARKPAADAKV